MQTNKQQEIKPVKLEETLNTKEKKKPEKKKEEVQMVEGIFRNWDVKGAPIKFSYYTKRVCGKGGPPKKYMLEDGGRYTIPLEVARHLNNCAIPVSKAEVDKKGNYIGKREELVRRCTFRRIDDLME